MNLTLKSLENHLEQQERQIESLKDIIQQRDYEISKLFHENRQLRNELKNVGGLTFEANEEE